MQTPTILKVSYINAKDQNLSPVLVLSTVQGIIFPFPCLTFATEGAQDGDKKWDGCSFVLENTCMKLKK